MSRQKASYCQHRYYCFHEVCRPHSNCEMRSQADSIKKELSKFKIPSQSTP